MTDVVLAFLTFGHILSAMGWLGGGLITGFALGPNLRKMSQTAALEFNAKVLPNLVNFVQAAAGLTIVFGLLLLGYLYSQDSAYFSSTSGMDVSVGIVLAAVTAAIAFSMTIPSFKKVSKISADIIAGKQQGPPPEMMNYAKRARQGSLVGVALLLIILAAMVAAGVS